MLHCTIRMAAVQISLSKPVWEKPIFCSSEQRQNVPNRFTRLCERLRQMNVVREFRNWRRYRNTVNELSRLTTRELNDLGIARADIPFVARKSL